MARISRRAALITGTIGAGVLIGWSLLPTQFDNPVRAAPDDALFNTYIRITASGSITMSIPVLDLGLGESTLLAQIMAQEMGADWRTIAIEPATPSAVYANLTLLKRWAPIIAAQDFGNQLKSSDYLLQRYAEQNPFMITGQASALANYLEPCRAAGAGARVLLAKAAADKWGINWEQCTISSGFVTYQDKALSFAEIAEEAALQDLPDILPLRPDWPGEGNRPTRNDEKRTAYPRLDLPAKVDGSTNFAADIRLPEMLFAAVRQGPLGESRVKSFDSKKPLNVQGVRKVVGMDDFVAVLADNWWAANQGLTISRPTFINVGRLADSDLILQNIESTLRTGQGYRLEVEGNADLIANDQEGDDLFVGEYRAGPALHCNIETQCATARFVEGRAEIWFAAQAPSQTVTAVANALDIPQRNVILYTMPSGGGYGKALDPSPAIQAALLARDSQQPVQVIWSRGEEQVQTLASPPAILQLSAKTGRDGAITALQHKIAAPAAGRQTMDRLFDHDGNGLAARNNNDLYDRHMIMGARGGYAITNLSIDHHPADIALPVGMMRGDSDTVNCFARESFIDELARKAGREPLSYRIQMLGKKPDFVACLSQAATLAGWDGGSANSGQGLACHYGDGAMIAVIADAQPGEGGVKVQKLTAAVNVGHIINPDIAMQQLESGMLQGLARALGGSSDYQAGLAVSRHLRDCNLPSLTEMPELEIFLMPATTQPIDADMIGIPAVAPAIANALFSATGFRFRQLPLI